MRNSSMADFFCISGQLQCGIHFLVVYTNLFPVLQRMGEPASVFYAVG